MEVSSEEERIQIKIHAPHVVILGAGASLASFPDGDKNGLFLPYVDNSNNPTNAVISKPIM